MNPTTLALEALSYIFVSGTNSNATIANASARQKARIANDITAALAEAYDLAPYFFRKPKGTVLAAPINTTGAVTHGSRTITLLEVVVPGSTISIGGYLVRTNKTSVGVDMLTEWQGATGSQDVTIYNDTIELVAEDARVIDNVKTPGVGKLVHRNNVEQLYAARADYPDYGRTIRSFTGSPILGRPAAYCPESQFYTSGANQAVARWIRVHPIPSAATKVEYSTIVNPPTYAADDLGNDLLDSSRTIVMPDADTYAAFRAFFLNKWQKSPWFKDKDARAEIKEDYALQRARLIEKHNALKRTLTFSPTV